ncbi:serine hydrolase domain-containing protein [Variovorax sp. CY25R-8]|uniref:serine hydrolase domain-containing protein n=1 Tax=Variovorax sp. CY25R-8 TaxID=2855501 RepID=UPI0021BB92B7|nr:serine hydrolase domain-containing protein [Variovorax sp. CY25R-8]MCT8180967.1 beta-lactamase family protein [Variovorax sp. CY25R-8]
MLRHPLPRARLAALVLSSFAFAAAHAQPATGFDTPPARLAAEVLGQRPGTVVAGTWREGMAHLAILRNAPRHAGTVRAMAPGEAQPVFEIGSISKVFTGLLLAQAVERGDFSLDDTLGRLLADKATLPPPVAAITLRQLITHTACLPNLPALPARPPGPDSNPFARPTRAHLMVALSSLELAQTPPCAPRYGSLGIALVGMLLSDRYGQPWDQLVRERIAVPLGMKDTVQHLDAARAKRLPQGYAGDAARAPWEFGALAAAGALRSTVPDLLLFARALMAGRAGPLGAAAERLREPLSAQGEYDVGYALRMRDPAAGGAQRRIYFHTGQTGGYRALLAFSPATNGALVLLASNDAAAVVPVLDALTLPLAAK